MSTYPVGPPVEDIPHPIDAEVAVRSANLKSNQWMLAIFLGWCGANLIQSAPKGERTGQVMLCVAMVVLGPCTFFVANLVMWVTALVMAGTEDMGRRVAEIRREAEASYLVRTRIGR